MPAALLAGCVVRGGLNAGPGGDAALTARPRTGQVEGLPAAGKQPLGLEARRDPLLYVPHGLRRRQAAPLVVTLHGAGGAAVAGLSLLRPFADEHGLVLLAPASRGSTWDGIRGGYGADVDAIDRALRRVFRTVPVDPERIAVAGFSDGASYALGLGLANGDLFQRVIAFSPGFVPAGRRVGKPRIFVSHGDEDQILPVGSTSRRLVPALRRDGYDVTYREFDGRHGAPPTVTQMALDWLDWGGAGRRSS
ncbi:MAG: alpha/beta hydrolase-fold protein [Actinomycetota bacterium]|nr:alpha/beta hydrolase-fold protein [Actinomycetota bacterium]